MVRRVVQKFNRRIAVVFALCLGLGALVWGWLGGSGAVLVQAGEKGPSSWEELVSPPVPEVIFGDERIKPILGNQSWGVYLNEADKEKGEMTQYVACGMHPLDFMAREREAVPTLGRIKVGAEPKLLRIWPLPGACRRLEAYLLPLEIPVGDNDGEMYNENRLRLAWQFPPDSLRVMIYDFAGWARRTCGNTETQELLLADFIPLDRESLPVWPGGGLYVLEASWSRQEGGEISPGGRGEYCFYLEQPALAEPPARGGEKPLEEQP